MAPYQLKLKRAWSMHAWGMRLFFSTHQVQAQRT
jgi:hypothetical protein